MKTQIHCTNDDCRQRKKCRKGQAMTNGNRVEYYFPSQPFADCEQFECIKHDFVSVLGQEIKQCRKCGELEFDGIDYDQDVWFDIPEVRKRLTWSDN